MPRDLFNQTFNLFNHSFFTIMKNFLFTLIAGILMMTIGFVAELSAQQPAPGIYGINKTAIGAQGTLSNGTLTLLNAPNQPYLIIGGVELDNTGAHIPGTAWWIEDNANSYVVNSGSMLPQLTALQTHRIDSVEIGVGPNQSVWTAMDSTFDYQKLSGKQPLPSSGLAGVWVLTLSQ